MPRSPASQDLLRRLQRMETELREIRLRSRAHTETKTFIVGGLVDESTYIPPALVLVNPDEQSQEWKRLLGFDGILNAGTVTIDWYRDGALLLAGHVLTSSGSTGGDLPEPLELSGGSWLQPVIVSASGATHLAAAFMVVTSR